MSNHEPLLKHQSTPVMTLLIGFALFILLCFALKYLGSVLAPFALAFFLAYALMPAVWRLEALSSARIPRAVCAVLVQLALFAAGLAVFILIVPVVTKQFTLLQARLPFFVELFNSKISAIIPTSLGIPHSLDGDKLKPFFIDFFTTNADSIKGFVFSSLKIGGSWLLSFLSYVLLVPLLLFYLLNDWERITKSLWEWLPKRSVNLAHELTKQIDAILSQYIRGQLIVILVLAFYFSLSLSLLELEVSLAVGLLSAVLIIIPYLGFAIGFILALIAGSLEFGFSHALLSILLIYAVGQVIEGFYLTPKFVGERIGLHPLGVIASLLVFGELFGFIGVIVALPLSAIIWVGIRRLKTYYCSTDWYLR